ncbi:hypothetical protein B0J18DRAFT_430494 [Chaetomium sp. MPI-SDFR-AT-0129]|nr:hypothetical protein B0J18DRAFT_430494 [Chaetomium sp. MPI-SDFR-AT-0129]
MLPGIHILFLASGMVSSSGFETRLRRLNAASMWRGRFVGHFGWVSAVPALPRTFRSEWLGEKLQMSAWIAVFSDLHDRYDGVYPPV